MGLAACEKLLSEPHLPQEHRERVANNKNLYAKIIQEWQQKMVEQQAKVLENVKNTANKTTLNFDPNKVAVTL
jgi:hypothetical protein